MTYELESVLDIEKWEKVQESIALATKLAIILVDYRGRPVTSHSKVQPFCHLARSTPKLAELCEKCDARGGLEAVRTGEPFIYRCHFDIIDLAVPIMLDGNYVGAIMAGEIKLVDGHDKLEQILNLPDNPLIEEFKKKHSTAYNNYPQLTLEELKKNARMIEMISEYVISEAIKKDYLVKSYKHSLQLINSNKIDNTHYEKIPTDSLSSIRKDIDATIIDQKINSTDDGFTAKNQQLQPAIDFIYTNKSDIVSLKDLAKLTNLSSSHLSRLLKEEFGESFQSVYIRLKINWAKDLLDNSSLSIGTISERLGYTDVSYFVRLFKRQTGFTPLKYRQLQQKKD
ncbi:PocR ligand-binding domain-containing protein [Vagococcus vulneris]|nr:PocR ligand-binding domain-containing protein [Vagococcus vulneris]